MSSLFAPGVQSSPVKTADAKAALLQKLIERGSLIDDSQTHLRLLPIHAEFVQPAPNQEPPAVGWLYWIDAGAEDQHHTHFRPYAFVEVLYDRDLRLLDASGNAVARVTSLDAWPLEHAEAMRERLALARVAISSSPSRIEAWADFVAGCRPRSEDAIA